MRLIIMVIALMFMYGNIFQTSGRDIKFDVLSDSTNTDTISTVQENDGNGRGYGRCHRGIRRTEFKDKNNDGICDDREGCIGIRHRHRGGDNNK